jgi:hypothetical protein
MNSGLNAYRRVDPAGGALRVKCGASGAFAAAIGQFLRGSPWAIEHNAFRCRTVRDGQNFFQK